MTQQLELNSYRLLGRSGLRMLGARTLKQLEDNLGALKVSLSDEDRERLEVVSAIELGFPHDLLRRPMTVHALTGGGILPQRTW
jgi:hypothetical protein